MSLLANYTYHPDLSFPLLRVMASRDGEDPTEPLPFDQVPSEAEDLPYKVELWDQAKVSVEQVLAVTANGSIGYAAYYAATREFPERHVTLRHKGKMLSSWNGPAQ